jgi:anhydro-N-acetylmuramic acid kinase
LSKISDTQPLNVMGLMSGTSVDGVDACLAKLWLQSGRLHHEMIATHSVDMPEDLRARLLTCMADKAMGLEELCALNVAVGELFADAATGLLKENNIPASQVDCIGSHGQTIFHWPPPPATGEESRRLGGTLQIGEPSIIAEKTGIYTIADFRPRDMAACGQGAPLVCFADLLLFQDDQIGRCIQNIGGIANVTVVPSREQHERQSQPVMAFDTGPGNMLMDAAMSHFYNKPYDENGDVAATGTIQKSLLVDLLSHPYLTQAPPKTTGREQFGEHFFREKLAQFPNLNPADWLATLTEFTAQTLADSYQQFVFPTYDVSEVVVGGGGAYNAFLRKRIIAAFQSYGREIVLKTHADFGIHDKYKEALAFAILAWASFLHHPNNLPECTGALHPVIMGKHILV